MVETLIKIFKQISKTDAEIAGGKGASLGEMTQAGIPVPEGFVILSNAFDRFLEETDLNVEIDAVLGTVNIKKVHTVENASEKIQAIILSREIPEDIKTEILKFYKNLDSKFVAVRSSATSEDSASAAWAGQLDSFLNTTKETLLENVKRCWASLFTPRAIFYRFEKKLNKDKISVAVVVQKMVDSEESGIAFSVHPVTQDENQIIIEAGFGLGEAIVSGSITPDSYVVDKQGFSILDINVNEQTKALYKKAKGGNRWKELGEKGKKQVLTEKEIIELSKLIVKIENHYGFPCDIEWVKKKDKFYIIQSRPITTLNSNSLNKNYLTELVKKLELNPSTERNLSLLTLSCVALAYTKFLRQISGLSYKSVAGLGDKTKWTSFLNEKDIIKQTEILIKKNQKKLKGRIIEPLYSDFLEVEKKLLARLINFRKNPENSFLRIIEIYPRYIAHIGLYNCFWRAIGDGKNISIPNELIKIIETNRQRITKYYPKIEKTLQETAKEIGKKNNFGGSLLLSFSYAEIIKKKNFKLLDKDVLLLRQRQDNYFYIYSEKNNKEIISINSATISQLNKNYMALTQSIPGEIKGTSAYPGIKTGIVLKVPNKTKNMPENMIIVVPMTHPKDIMLIRKSEAIITDEGGILSHAAIISRELQKPCIIGTKIATKILNDGDLVEVDANQGIIKVLKKAKQ
ncbi:MAG: PEP/pyruvate-binding domain-containing protein [Patescibacteria group bacterium]|jgi:phosphoenolpyruvate synthase/pyruvate phosphate dikinase